MFRLFLIQGTGAKECDLQLTKLDWFFKSGSHCFVLFMEYSPNNQAKQFCWSALLDFEFFTIATVACLRFSA